jgi:hypothetical protein
MLGRGAGLERDLTPTRTFKFYAAESESRCPGRARTGTEAEEKPESAAMSLLTEEQVSQYLTRGYFVLPAFFAEADLAALRPAAPAGAAATAADAADAAYSKCVVFGCARTGEDPTKINKLEGLGRLAAAPHSAQLAALFKSVGQSPRLAAIARQLLGAGAALMKDKYIFKGKGGGDGFPPHQDMNFIYSRLATDAVNFGVAFDAADASNGALEVCVERYGELGGASRARPLRLPRRTPLWSTCALSTCAPRRGTWWSSPRGCCTSPPPMQTCRATATSTT